MPTDTICRTIHQYNSAPISEEDMRKLTEIANDYSNVKNYVYQRYGGIKSLPKLYPGYTIQNEMTESGLRAQLGLPSVYFYLAVFDALGDIKDQWTQTKRRVSKRIYENENFTPEEKHYLRFVLKQSKCFESILLSGNLILEGNWEKVYKEICAGIETGRLDRYLRRQVRKNLRKLHTDTAMGFSVSERAYRYDDHGIYISIKEKRKRLFIPLTDCNRYKKQLHVNLRPDEGNIVIHVPIERKVRYNGGGENEVGLAFGLMNMFVTNFGNVYGERYNEYQSALTDYVRNGTASYRKNKKDNPGRKKYYAGKRRLEAALHTYINSEINRLLDTEKPKRIYIPKLPQASKSGVNKKINSSISMWQKGYIRKRLREKCEERSIKLVEVFGKDISNECSCCGNIGVKEKEMFTCKVCQSQMLERVNTARNVIKRGMAARAI